jgi:hypothetical protein
MLIKASLALLHIRTRSCPSLQFTLQPLSDQFTNAATAQAAMATGGRTLMIQNESPGKDQEANWLPVPKGPFSMIMRLCWPKQAAVQGKWKQPPLQRAG